MAERRENLLIIFALIESKVYDVKLIRISIIALDEYMHLYRNAGIGKSS